MSFRDFSIRPEPYLRVFTADIHLASRNEGNMVLLACIPHEVRKKRVHDAVSAVVETRSALINQHQSASRIYIHHYPPPRLIIMLKRKLVQLDGF
jgi:hypothetical protein